MHDLVPALVILVAHFEEDLWFVGGYTMIRTPLLRDVAFTWGLITGSKHLRHCAA